MMQRLILFVLSFLIGIYLFFPYRLFYTGLIKRLEGRLPSKIDYTVEDAYLTGLRLKNLTVRLKQGVIHEDDLLVRLNPLGLMLDRDLLALKRKGLFLKVRNSSRAYLIEGRFNKYRDPNLKGIIDGDFSIEIGHERGNLLGGRMELVLRDLRLPGNNLGFDRVTLKGKIKEGVIEIERLTAEGKISAQIQGRIFQDTGDFLNSRAELSIRYRIGEGPQSTEFRGPLSRLMVFQSLLSRP
ncbi:MAG: hypothetical protein D6710_05130 [Nitrospirae bacterium]|nr:MAG: hypothetical protein D6710_05130 [Nitrospirota bacterium]